MSVRAHDTESGKVYQVSGCWIMIPHLAFIVILEKGLDDDGPGQNCRSGSSAHVLITGVDGRLHLASVENEGGGESRM